MGAWLDMSGLGSSPLARGTRCQPAPEWRSARFIPARAGNTELVTGLQGRPAVHPRSRGEHNAAATTPISAYGSSPLARGTPLRKALPACRLRFIPARAGNTAAWPRGGTQRPVHPRSRGEHALEHVRAACEGGSSPLARGTRGPAACSRSPSPVHPRSRGEHLEGGANRHDVSGSSPLARGTRQDQGRGDHCVRFIPARAGNTPAGRLHRPASAVHPRSRGEHLYGVTPVTQEHGSSPLARGTPPKR